MASPTAHAPSPSGKRRFAVDRAEVGGNFVTANVASTIQNAGLATSPSGSRNPIGIRAVAATDVPVSVTYTGAGITTTGSRGTGIIVQSGGGAELP
jgi:hypothetical protein